MNFYYNEEDEDGGSEESREFEEESEASVQFERDPVPLVKKTNQVRKTADGYTSEIYNVITKHSENPLEMTAFAIGGELDNTMGIPAVHVEGVGRIGYPLSKEQAVPLIKISKQAPFGLGKKTVVDIKVRRAWEIESNLVKINQKWIDNVLPNLVTQCCTKLGVDAVKMKVRANLYKMLLYEEGGHFKKHRDTEKEPGMFGSLLIQLPAEHEGGHLVVEHDKTIKRYPFDKESADKGYYTAFYADCEHTLEPVTKGLRLVLAFNLVRGGGATLAPATAANIKGYEEVLVAAGKAWLDDKNPLVVQKLVVPLAYKYTHTNMSFTGLKGEDHRTLNLLQGVADPQTKEKVFSVYLALVTKHVSGYSDEQEYDCRYSRYSRSAPLAMDTGCDIEITYETEKWMGPHGEVDLGDLSIDFDEEVLTASEESTDVLTEDIFGTSPDEEEGEGYCGNYAGTLEYWYHSAVLVFWPAQRDFDMKLAADPWQAVALLEGINKSSPDYSSKLSRLLAFLATNPTGGAWSVPRVLALAQTLDQVKSIFALIKHNIHHDVDHEAIIARVQQYGWEALGKEFTLLISSAWPDQVIKLLIAFKQRSTFTEGSKGSKGKGSKTATSVSIPLTAWKELLTVIVARILQARKPDPSAYDRMSKAERAADTSVIILDLVWPEVSRFVVTNCEGQQQAVVAAHAVNLMALQPLNALISAGGLPEGPYLVKLRSGAVQKCIEKAQQLKDIIETIDWVVRARHVELMTRLQPTLQRLCDNSDHFSTLFALPSVLAELKTDSPVSQVLESFVQKRIAAITPHTIAPAFSWRMAANQIDCNDARVTAFLTSDQQTITLAGGFGGIIYARKWITRYLGYNRGACGVTGEVFGSGQKAGVVLTKNASIHDATVRRCAQYASELSRLHKILGIHDSSRGTEECVPAHKKIKVDVWYMTDPH